MGVLKMNFLNRWTRGLALRFATRKLGASFSIMAKARGSEDLTPVGSWDVLWGTDVMKSASEIWKSYSKSQLEKIVSLSSVVFSCIRKIATSAPEAVPHVVVGYDEDMVYRDDDPILSILRNPNPYMSYDDYVGTVTAHLGIYGESNTLEVPDAIGGLAEIYPIPKSWISENRDRNGNLTSYSISMPKLRKPIKNIPIEAVTTLLLPDPANPFTGLGPLQAATRPYQLEDEMDDYLAEMLHNMTFPGPIIKRQAKWEEPQKDEVRKLFRDMFGKGHRGKDPLFLSGGKDAAIEYLAPLKDLDWPGLRGLTETRICSVFGVSPILIDLRSGLERSTYENVAQADRKFYRQTMSAMWRALASGWTRGFLRGREGVADDRRIILDTSNVVQLQEDQNEKSTRIRGEFNDGIITLNEARTTIGYEEFKPEVGDVRRVPISVVETPLVKAASRLPELEDDEEEGKKLLPLKNWKGEEL
jgi:HK97 family phage portal protein